MRIWKPPIFRDYIRPASKNFDTKLIDMQNPSPENKKSCFRRVWKIAETMSFVMSVCLSVRPSIRPRGSHWPGFQEILFEYFSKICQ
jgi:hypothetical protein